MKKPGGTLNGFLDQGCSIKGDIVFADLLRVHGHATGTVRSDGELLVGEGGVVEGEIMVARLVVAGTVRGTIKARERLVVHSSGRITAEIATPVLVVDEGGVVEGTVNMTAPGPQAGAEQRAGSKA
ncbi:MAG: polymer-forming cytoskeletal protein [Thermoanaerobaculaceae bacterium]|jgi:cytoskeletal protein CcmA (bactofilin family)|nr:polymer-forming cytoskeletal protein [Thermoanaerobaculaceae bacterium]